MTGESMCDHTQVWGHRASVQKVDGLNLRICVFLGDKLSSVRVAYFKSFEVPGRTVDWISLFYHKYWDIFGEIQHTKISDVSGCLRLLYPGLDTHNTRYYNRSNCSEPNFELNPQLPHCHCQLEKDRNAKKSLPSHHGDWGSPGLIFC